MALYILVNDVTIKLNKCISIEDLISFLSWNQKAIAIEYNSKIIQPALWPKTLVRTKDQFEIVTLIGGG